MQATLCKDEEFVSPSMQCPPNLTFAFAVHCSGIENIDAGIGRNTKQLIDKTVFGIHKSNSSAPDAEYAGIDFRLTQAAEFHGRILTRIQLPNYYEPSRQFATREV